MAKVWLNKGKSLLEEIENTSLQEDEIALWYLGQSGFLIKKGSQKIVIDPVLSDLTDVKGQTRRYYEIPFLPEDLPADFVFCTHGHRDHYNLPTIKGLAAANPNLKIVIPAGLKTQLIADGFDPAGLIPINEMNPESIDGLQITGLSAAHPTILKDEAGNDLNLAYLLQIGPFKLLHLGDTYLCEELIESLEANAGIDVLIAPINGQDYFRTARNCIGNLNSYEAAYSAQIAKARMTIPCHYDMIMGNTCSPVSFIESMEEVYPQGAFALPRLGERLVFKK